MSLATFASSNDADYPQAPNVPGTQSAGAHPAQLIETATGAVLSAPGWDGVVSNSVTPMFSPDGTMIAFTHYDTGQGHSLATMSFTLATHAFAGLKDVATDPNNFLCWPAFSPDTEWLVYQTDNRADYGTWNSADSPPGTFDAQGDLYVVHLPSNTTAHLDSVDGYTSGQLYLPYGAVEATLNFEPTVLPVAVGGYYWVVFTSRRDYGNTIVTSDQEDQPAQEAMGRGARHRQPRAPEHLGARHQPSGLLPPGSGGGCRQQPRLLGAGSLPGERHGLSDGRPVLQRFLPRAERRGRGPDVRVRDDAQRVLAGVREVRADVRLLRVRGQRAEPVHRRLLRVPRSAVDGTLPSCRLPAGSMIERLAVRFSAWAERWLPDAFVFALLATLVVFVAGLTVGHASPVDLTESWGKGFWDLTSFTMQMVLVIVTGYVLASSRPIARLIGWLARLPADGARRHRAAGLLLDDGVLGQLGLQPDLRGAPGARDGEAAAGGGLPGARGVELPRAGKRLGAGPEQLRGAADGEHEHDAAPAARHRSGGRSRPRRHHPAAEHPLHVAEPGGRGDRDRDRRGRGRGVHARAARVRGPRPPSA